MMKTGGFFAGRRSHSVTLQPTSETSWLADFRVAPRWPSRRWAILALVGRVVKLEDHDIRAAILRMGRIVAISCCIRILGITTTNLHDLEWTALLAPVLKHVNCVGKSADEGRGDASSASCRHPAGAVLFGKDPWPSQACPCQELSSSAGPVSKLRRAANHRGAQAACNVSLLLPASGPTILSTSSPLSWQQKMQAASGPAGPLIRKDRDRKWYYSGV